MTRQTNATQKIGFNDRQPFGVGDLFKVLDFINAQVVHENIQVGVVLCGLRCRVGFGQIKREPFEFRCWHLGANGRNGFPHTRLGASVDDHASALGGERSGNGQTDPGCGTTDKREFIFELEIQSEITRNGSRDSLTATSLLREALHNVF